MFLNHLIMYRSISVCDCPPPTLSSSLLAGAQTLVAAMDRYQARNMLLLYDTIGQVAAATGDAFNAHPTLGTCVACWCRDGRDPNE
jgi:hypothetical protein